MRTTAPLCHAHLIHISQMCVKQFLNVWVRSISTHKKIAYFNAYTCRAAPKRMLINLAQCKLLFLYKDSPSPPKSPHTALKPTSLLITLLVMHITHIKITHINAQRRSRNKMIYMAPFHKWFVREIYIWKCIVLHE